MKFSTTTVLVLANGIAALPSMPWSKKVAKEEITLHFEVAQEATMTDLSEICWAACFSEEFTCPEGLHAKQKGDCWTCCVDNTLDAKTNKVAAKEMQIVTQSADVCWMACFFEEPTCPDTWGDCWTCCKDVSANEVGEVKAKELSLKDFTTSARTEDICLAVCWSEKPTSCPTGGKWHPKNFGDCWTCCRDFDDESVSKAKSEDLRLKKFTAAAPVHAQDTCLLICAPQPLTCAPGWVSKQLGSCHTCCKDAGDNDVAKQVKPKTLNLQNFKTSTSVNAPDICWLVCAAEEFQCPEGWHSKKTGDCYSCCLDQSQQQANVKELRLQL